MKVPGFLKPIGEIYASAGHRCFLVGGAVRNMVLGRRPTDYDMATDAPPEVTMKLFRKVIPTGVKHGTVTILFKGRQFEVTTFRRDQEYSDGRRPDSVEFTSDIYEDLARRDFTINAMAVDVCSGEFVDVHGGVSDARAGIVRAIGIPEDRFREDGLRLLRAVRFAAQLDFRIEDDTFRAVQSMHSGIERVSWERIRDEVEKILLSDHPVRGLALMRDSGLLGSIFPELAACVGVPQEGGNDVFEHSIAACEGAENDLSIRLAALLHDIGKAPTMAMDEDGAVRFHRHEQVSADLADRVLARLRFPNRLRRSVTHLIRHHMFNYTEDWSDGAVRRFVSRVGVDAVDALFALREADTFGKTGRRTRNAKLDALRRRIESVLDRDHALGVRDLAVDGNDLHEYSGVPRGPAMGVVLDFLLETVLDDPRLNTRETLLEIARRYYETRVSPGRDQPQGSG